jgi:hypothetical protein
MVPCTQSYCNRGVQAKLLIYVLFILLILILKLAAKKIHKMYKMYKIFLMYDIGYPGDLKLMRYQNTANY